MKLKKISQAELDKILKQHQEWLNSDGNKGHRAGLDCTDLSGMDLKDANLWYAYLRNADLHGAKLHGAKLQGTYLRNADLQYADLHSADLWSADLQCANLQGAYLWGANLQGAYLWGANLEGANLRGAFLQGANLQGANLQEADLRNADLVCANWHEVKNIRVYVAGLMDHCENDQLTYIPSIDVATVGDWQGTWHATVKKIHSIYAENTQERKANDLAIEYIQAQIQLSGSNSRNEGI